MKYIKGAYESILTFWFNVWYWTISVFTDALNNPTADERVKKEKEELEASLTDVHIENTVKELRKLRKEDKTMTLEEFNNKYNFKEAVKGK